MDGPLLHVMIPVYGESPFLRHALLTATNFLPNEIPITVVEDGSPDQSVEKIVEEFPRVNYIRNDKRLGITKNFNKCLQLSSGIYTQIIGSDDEFIESNLYIILKNIITTNEDIQPDIIFFNAKVIGDNNKNYFGLVDIVKMILKPKNEGIITANKLINSLLLGQWVYFPATLWKTKVTSRLGFNDKYSTAFDLDYLISESMQHKQFYNCRHKIIAYRRHKDSVSSVLANTGIRFKEELEIHNRYSAEFRKKKQFMSYLLAKIALTVRINKFLSFLSNKV
jgi:glycosyltransferase involved in cell wall biosynthesis